MQKQVCLLETAVRLGARLKRSGHEFVGPCPRCGGTDRFSLNVARGLWNCRICRVGGDAIGLARHLAGMTFAEALAFVRDPRGDNMALSGAALGRWRPPVQKLLNPAPNAENVDHALASWCAGLDPRGTPAEIYLNRRGLALDADIAGKTLRWHPGVGAMLGLFKDVLSDAARGISRTFLAPDGKKIGRRFLGVVGGSAIQFDKPGVELTVAEGIETALTARALGCGPSWACGSAGAIGKLPVIPGAQRLRICAERDDNGVSERHAVQCADRWEAAGRAVSFKLPPPRTKDLNDCIRQDEP